jgi:hypothetical protein
MSAGRNWPLSPIGVGRLLQQLMHWEEEGPQDKYGNGRRLWEILHQLEWEEEQRIATSVTGSKGIKLVTWRVP